MEGGAVSVSSADGSKEKFNFARVDSIKAWVHPAFIIFYLLRSTQLWSIFFLDRMMIVAWFLRLKYIVVEAKKQYYL